MKKGLQNLILFFLLVVLTSAIFIIPIYAQSIFDEISNNLQEFAGESGLPKANEPVNVVINIMVYFAYINWQYYELLCPNFISIIVVIASNSALLVRYLASNLSVTTQFWREIMNTLLQVDFDYSGPFGSEMASKLKELAESINHEPGMIWKIWAESGSDNLGGGIYLF